MLIKRITQRDSSLVEAKDVLSTASLVSLPFYHCDVPMELLFLSETFILTFCELSFLTLTAIENVLLNSSSNYAENRNFIDAFRRQEKSFVAKGYRAC